LVTQALSVGMIVTLAWSDPQKEHETKLPVFSAKYHKLIEEYYLHLVGALAPGSLDRSEFPLGVEQSLVAGSHVPMQLEKDLKPLPAKLESQLTAITGDYARYTLGRHVVLVHKTDLAITDMIKNVAVK